MNVLKAMVGSLLLAVVPLAAQAEDMSYSYVELGWNELDLDDTVDGDGLGLRGSIGFAENFFAFADYSMFEFPGNVDLELYTVGIGAHIDMTENMDLVGRIGYANADAEVGGTGFPDDSGYLVSAGVRGRVMDGLELEGGVVHVDFGNDADDTALSLGGRYFFTENFAVGLDAQFGDTLDTIFAGVRYAF